MAGKHKYTLEIQEPRKKLRLVTVDTTWSPRRALKEARQSMPKGTKISLWHHKRRARIIY